MKQLLKSELNGTVLFKKVLMFLLAYIVCIVGMFLMLQQDFLLGYFLVLILVMVSAFALQFQFISSLINAVSLDDQKFEFTGSFGGFMTVCIKGFLLTMVTLGIYGAWFEKNIVKYISENTSFPEKAITFNGTGGKLFKYMILSFFIPCIIVGIILGVGFTDVIMGLSYGSYSPDVMSGMAGFLFIYIVGVFTISSIYTYFIYKWFINFTFGDQEVKLDSSALSTILFVLGQMFLTMITFGIYGFAAQIKIFKYFANNTTLTDISTNVVTPVSFVGQTGMGFGLLLGQTLLCMITFGIYLPWAYANIQNWFISNIELGD